MRRRRIGRFGVALLLVAVTVAAVQQVRADHLVSGDPAPAETILPAGRAPTVSVRHVGPVAAVNASDDAAVAGVLTDLNAFWASTLPAAFGRRFAPLAGGYVSVDSTAGTGTTSCISWPEQLAGNAYYCPSADAIVYDSSALVPVLLGHYGIGGLTASFAHEFGHAIQARIGPTAADRSAHPDRFPSILAEAQGDCYAGSFLAWVTARHSARVRLPASSLVRAVAPLLDFRDPVDIPVNDPTAHGLSLDRLTALLRGYRGGALSCSTLARSDLDPTLGRAGLLTGRHPHRFPDNAAALAAARASIAAFTATLPHVGSPALASVRPAPADMSAAAPYGQFATAAALALAVGRSVTESAPGAACFTGAWTASVFGHAAPGGLGSWPGDADEALDMLRARQAVGFDELAGYADGFAHGWSACTDQ